MTGPEQPSWIEVEMKYRLRGPDDHVRLRAALSALGARGTPMHQERNDLFDSPDGALGREGGVLRLRVVNDGPGALLTYKGPARFDGALKSRQEIQTEVADAAAAQALLAALGYRQTLHYAKQREAWQIDGVEVSLDTLDLGHFCELEGAPAAIEALASRLPLDGATPEPAGYPTLMARHLAARSD